MFSYIHIPFCESKCKYCRFASVWNIDRILVKKYLAHLIFDINSYDKKIEKLDSIYFWWWTPSILTYDDLKSIIDNLKNKFWFKNNIEITLETTPKNINLENLKSWEQLWINRISFWIQTLNDKSLKEINREWSDITLNALEILKQSNIKNISCDFIIWLPFVEIWEIKKDIDYVLKNYNYLTHISVYMLEDYYQVDLDENAKFEKIKYPNNWKNIWIEENDYLKEYLEIKKYLEKLGFFRYELSNFSKNWFECKHNKAYWNHSEMVWFWLWSHSFLNNIRYAYKDDFLWYYKKEFLYKEDLNENDLFLEKIMFWFRTNWINKDLFDKFNQEKLNYFLDKKILEKNSNYIKINDNYITLTDKIISELI